MKIRPGQADRNEKASSVYRLRQSTKDERMKRCMSTSEPFLAVMKGMWPRRPLGWCEPLYHWSSSGSKTTWVGGFNVLGLMGQPRNGRLLPLAFRKVSLVHYCLEESLMISRMAPKARLWLKTTRSLKTTEILSRLDLFSCANVDNQQDLRPRYLHFISLSLSRTGANGVKTRLALTEKNWMQGWQCTAKGWYIWAQYFGWPNSPFSKKNIIINGS